MRAAVFHQPGIPLSVESVDDPQSEAGQVVIAVKRSGICGTDLHATEDREQRLRLIFLKASHDYVGVIGLIDYEYGYPDHTAHT